MKIQETNSDNVISLLQCAKKDEDCEIFENWEQYQKWVLDTVYNKNFQVLSAIEENKVVGFLIWQLYQVYYKWHAHLHYVYVLPEYRKTDTGIKLIVEFIHNSYNSSAQRLRFDTRVLSNDYIELIVPNAPFIKFKTYYADLRSEEAKRYYNENLRKNNN